MFNHLKKVTNYINFKVFIVSFNIRANGANTCSCQKQSILGCTFVFNYLFSKFRVSSLVGRYFYSLHLNEFLIGHLVFVIF